MPQLANMVEGGGQTPILPPAELYRLGFVMIAYPTTLLFRVTRAIEQALADLKAGRPQGNGESVDFGTFKEIAGMPQWGRIEDQYGRKDRGRPS